MTRRQEVARRDGRRKQDVRAFMARCVEEALAIGVRSTATEVSAFVAEIHGWRICRTCDQRIGNLQALLARAYVERDYWRAMAEEE